MQAGFFVLEEVMNRGNAPYKRFILMKSINLGFHGHRIHALILNFFLFVS